jgi:hypothetical protein
MWVFNERHDFGVETDPTEGEFFVNNDIDRSSALVREAIQNSLDARREDVGKVEVRLHLHEGALFLDGARTQGYVEDLLPHLTACGLDVDSTIFNNPRFLVVEDFGTHGLRGSINSKDPSDFYYFWHVVGRSGKGDQKAGRWGLGKTVFPNSSQVSAFLGYTVRSDDRRHFLFGQTCLKTHESAGRTYLPYAFYQSSAPREFELPFEDPDKLRVFRQDFKLERTEEPGLSVVIPFPYPEITENDLIEAAIEHYFYPILAGQLVVRVNERTLDAKSILPIAERIEGRRLRDIAKALSFAAEIQRFPTDSIQTVDAPIHLDSATSRVPPDAFHPEHLVRLREDFHSDKLIALRVPVLIESRTNNSETSFITIYIKRDPLLSRGHDYYLRNGITLSGQSVFGSRPALGILLAEDLPICRFLGDAENPAHTLWNPRSPRLGGRYRNASETVRFVRDAMVSFLDTLTQLSTEEDLHALSEIFFTPRRAEREDKARQSDVKGPADIPESTEEPKLLIVSAKGGFKLKAGPGFRSDSSPMPVSVVVAYEIRHGNPFKKYDPNDFRLDREPVMVKTAGVSNLRCSANRLDFIAAPPLFEVDVSGFDVHRDLKVRVDEGRDEE